MAGRVQLRGLWTIAALAALLPALGAAQRYDAQPPPLTVDPCAVHPNPRFPVTPDPKAKPPVCPPPSAASRAGSPAPGDAHSAPSQQQFPFPGDADPKAAGSGANGSGSKPSAADQFPYPGSAPAPGARETARPAAPDAATPAGQFPYPGETSASPDAVPEGNTPRYVPDSPAPGQNAPASDSKATDDSSSSSSSSSGNDSPATPADDRDQTASGGDAGDTRAGAKGRRRLPKVSAQSTDERVAEDLNVAKFYSGMGNFTAAYLRSKDAATVMPDDPESHFALAQAAQKLKKTDEAVTEYNTYLKLDPAGDHTLVAQKALSQLR